MSKTEQRIAYDEQLELLQYLWERRYTLETIGISAKMVFDWSKQGLLLDPVKPKTRRKYCVIEYIWFKLIIGLREFGMSLESIRNVRTMLLETMNMTDTLEFFMTMPLEELRRIEFSDVEKAIQGLAYLQKQKEASTPEEWAGFIAQFNMPGLEYFNTLLCHLVLDGISYRTKLVFNISSTGETFIESGEKKYFEQAEQSNKPHIKFPVSSLISQFVQHEEMGNPEELVYFNFLTEKEMQILDLLKNDKLVSLTVRMGQNQEIKLIESEERIHVENASSRLTDHLMNNNYQEIICKTQNGKVTSMRRTTKHK